MLTILAFVVLILIVFCFNCIMCKILNKESEKNCININNSTADNPAGIFIDILLDYGKGGPQNNNVKDQISSGDPFFDSQGRFCYPGDPFYDTQGRLCYPGDPFYDTQGRLCYPGDPFYDYNDRLCYPGDPFYDSEGRLCYPANINKK